MALNGTELVLVTGIISGGPSSESFLTTTQQIANLGGGSSGGITATLITSENISAGALINIFSNAGVATIRNANATDTTKPAHGFCPSAISSGQSGTYIGGGAINTNISGLTAGSTYYLSISSGSVTATPPSTPGNSVQEVGQALSSTSLAFFPKTSVGV